MFDSQAIRQAMKTKRSHLPETIQCDHSRAISDHVTSTTIFQTSQHIAAYIAHLGEVDARPIIEKIWELGKQCYLPVITDDGDSLWFVPYDHDDTLVHNKFNILEPTRHNEKISAKELELVLTPLVAFDKKYNRLGMGAGFYDKTFYFLKNKPQSNPHLMGLAYDFQQTEDFQAQEWDIPLNSVITNGGINI